MKKHRHELDDRGDHPWNYLATRTRMQAREQTRDWIARRIAEGMAIYFERSDWPRHYSA